jgi:Phosphotransferase enzyme family
VTGYHELDLRPDWHREARPRTTVELERGVSAAVGQPVELVARRANPHSSTFLAEILTCRIDGRTQDVLCKFGPLEYESGFGHRGGLAYEGRVYAEMIPPGLNSPRFFGTYVDEAAGETWLLVEWLADGMRVDVEPDAMPAAAAWAGAFHGAHDGAAARHPAFLKRYDAGYFLSWPDRALELVADVDAPWLGAAAERLEDALPALLEGPHTVIHGEYTVHNVIARDGIVYPIDWQSAAVSAGEIDLASLTENWEVDVAEACEAAYVAARWGGEARDGFRERLFAARLYLHFRWLGDPALVDRPHRRLWRFKAVRRLVEEGSS